MENNFKADWPSFALGFNTGKSKGGGGAELNIAYGDTPPEDTSKLWVKTSEPSGVVVSADMTTDGGTGENEYRKLSEEMPVAQYDGVTGQMGNEIYIIGGYANQGTAAGNLIHCFDTEKEVVTTLQETLPVAVCRAGGIQHNGDVYVVGGYGNKSGVQCFNLETKKASTISCVLAAGLDSGRYVCLGSKLVYIMTGTVVVFDAAKKESYAFAYTTTHTVIPTAAMVIGNTVYFLGADYNTSSTVLYRVDVDAQAVEYVQEVYPALLFAVSAVIGDKCYLFGQDEAIRCFDPNTLAITTLQETRYVGGNSMTKAIKGETVYLFGAYDSRTTPVKKHKTIETYTVATPKKRVDTDVLHISPHAEENIFSLINADTVKVEIGVDSVYKGNAEGIGEKVESALYKDGAWTNI